MTKLVVYIGLNEVLVTTRKQQKAFEALYFPPNSPNYRQLEDYDINTNAARKEKGFIIVFDPHIEH